MNSTDDFHNCTYCGTRIPTNIPSCTRCGAANVLDPQPWATTMWLRFKSSLVSKQESVWADRLASLMPLHFIFALYTMYLGNQIGFEDTFGFFVILVSAFCLIFIGMYYPDWYKEIPEIRKNSGQMYMLFLVLHTIIIFNLF